MKQAYIKNINPYCRSGLSEKWAIERGGMCNLNYEKPRELVFPKLNT